MISSFLLNPGALRPRMLLKKCCKNLFQNQLPVCEKLYDLISSIIAGCGYRWKGKLVCVTVHGVPSEAVHAKKSLHFTVCRPIHT